MLTSRTRMRLPNNLLPKTAFLSTGTTLRCALAGGLAQVFLLPLSGGILEAYVGAFTIFCASESPSKRDSVSQVAVHGVRCDEDRSPYWSRPAP